LLEKDLKILDLIEQAGGRVVLDATEGGERTLPDVFDRRRLAGDPLGELARAYFGTIPDVFRRPNDSLFDWLDEAVSQRRARGLLFHRYVWCDVWHAELSRVKQRSAVPVLEIDECDDDASLSRTGGRIEAFLELLR
jgi:benzoyl-CoA reductase/2-hydroxyglutaryl-CoA dehydratase subunit BcrC/BadD/HgdB